MKVQSSKFKVQSKYRSGQIVLMLVLVTVVGLTVGLSLISRTITDIRISSQIEQSNRAFSAAEAGIESALKGTNIVPTGTVNLSGAQANYSIQSIGGGSEAIVFPFTKPGEVQTVWLVDHDSEGTILASSSYPASSALTFCFGSIALYKPALIGTFVYSDGTNFKIAKVAFDGDPLRIPPNGFTSADASNATCPSGYAFMKTITPTDLSMGAGVTLYALRIQVVYQGTALAVMPGGGSNLPIQGKIITSVGQTDTGIVRRIQVSQGYSVLPILMDFALFSEN